MAESEPRLQFVDTSAVFPPIDRSSREIRLLHLLPSSTEENISCTLSVVSLDRRPPYEALSYVWGENDNPATITVNDQPFKVTKNLYGALINLIPEDSNDSPRVFWIDAVCINQGGKQGELEERVHQVNLMGRIFANATSVTAYLGDPFPGLDIAMQYLTLAAEKPDWHIGPSIHPHLQVSGSDANTADLIRSLVDIFSRPWWRRIWTLQECVLAREVSFQVGKFRHAADEVYRGVVSLVRYESNECCDDELSSTDPDGRQVDVWSHINRPYYQTELLAGDWSLSVMIVNSRDLECTDPRDKVYSLLGICSGSPVRIVPYYKVTPEQLFRDISLSWANNEGYLDFLSCIYRSAPVAGRLDLPTWAVDWSLNCPSPTTEPTFFEYKAAANNLFDTHLGTRATCSFQSQGRVIAKGFIFDTVIPGPVVRGITYLNTWTQWYQ